jgi:hypothetical protein
LINQLPKTPIVNLPFRDPYLSYAYAISGDTTHAKITLENTLRTYPEQDPIHLTYAYIALKNYDAAINMLESAYKIHSIQLYWIKVDPNLDALRNEPRFKALLKKMNLG